MIPDDEDKPKKPITDFGYVMLVIIAILVAYFVVLPVGQRIAATFQTLTDALSGKR